MRCSIYHKSKSKLSKDSQRRLNNLVTGFVQMSNLIGVDKALEIINDNKKGNNDLEES